MSDPRKEGLVKFADFIQRARIERQVTDTFEDLHATLSDARTSLGELETLLSDILFGEGERANCGR